MVKQVKKLKETYSIAEIYGYTHKHFKKWGKLGGRPKKYVSPAERQKAYRQKKLSQISKWRNNWYSKYDNWKG